MEDRVCTWITKKQRKELNQLRLDLDAKNLFEVFDTLITHYKLHNSKPQAVEYHLEFSDSIKKPLDEVKMDAE